MEVKYLLVYGSVGGVKLMRVRDRVEGFLFGLCVLAEHKRIRDVWSLEKSRKGMEVWSSVFIFL
jgi:hypothetical protein